MKRLSLFAAAILILCSLGSPCAFAQTGASVLVFSKTEGFRHASIEAGVQMVEALGAANGFEVDHTEDARHFTEGNLGDYSAVVFLSTTGDVLNADQQAAFEAYIRGGGGFVGIHAAADTEYDWPWYGELVGAYFESHPPGTPSGTVIVNDRVHPSTRMLPLRWQRTDEWYNYKDNPRGDVHVLLTLDESTYSGGTDGHDHPIAWCRPYDGGRSWYTGGGHTEGSYAEELFRAHVLGGIQWAIGAVEGDCSATLDQSFEKVILDDDANDPMELTVLPDGRVVYVERPGTVKIYDDEARSTTVAAQLSVHTGQEDGLLGITHDPNFSQNSWIYLFYSPSGADAKQRISRFALDGSTLDQRSERVLLEIPTQRAECCHSGGSLAFGPDGNLYASLGDDTNPFASDGYAPIDERSGRAAWDAQRTAGNTQDLRGKILRITPQADGTYTIPDGNLFSDPLEGRPEIYVMGNRNPFRIAVDQETGWLYWGEVGPDAGSDNPNRGPRGYDEFNQAREAGNFGWPYCIAEKDAYVEYDFGTGTSGTAFDCQAGPANDSPNNDGASQLPPARPAWLWYPYGPSSGFPELDGSYSRTAMGGPVYHFDERLTPNRKLPEYYDDTAFIYEWSRNWLREVKLDEEGNVLKINPFLNSMTFRRPMEMELGPDGALYMLEWGSSFGGGNPDAQLVRISYTAGPQGPVAVATAAPTSGPIPLTVEFDGGGSYHPDSAGKLTFQWDFDGDGTFDASGPRQTYTYYDPGSYLARLVVNDGEGFESSDEVNIVAGNSAPVVEVLSPVAGGIVGWGERVSFEVRVSDAEDGSTEDGSIDCANVSVRVTAVLGSEDHVLDEFAGCEGALETVEHADLENGVDAYHVLAASYSDQGAPNEDPRMAEASVILQPKRKDVEHYSTNGGVEFEPTSDPTGGGMNAGWIDHGDFLSFAPVNLKNIDAITFRVASASTGGRIEIRLDAVDGPLVGSAQVFGTGGWQSWTTVTANVSDPGGTHELYLRFKRDPGATGLFNINYLTFEGSGISVGAEGLLEIPTETTLARPYPNPFSRETTIRYSIAETKEVAVEVFDVAGRRVASLVEGPTPAGIHEVRFTGDGLASGVYFVRLTSSSGTISRPLVLTR